jgi:hypothetical protein
MPHPFMQMLGCQGQGSFAVCSLHSRQHNGCSAGGSSWPRHAQQPGRAAASSAEDSAPRWVPLVTRDTNASSGTISCGRGEGGGVEEGQQRQGSGVREVKHQPSKQQHGHAELE